MQGTLGQTPSSAFRRDLWKPGEVSKIEGETTFDDLPTEFADGENTDDPPTMDLADDKVEAKAEPTARPSNAPVIGVAIGLGLFVGVGLAIVSAAALGLAWSTDVAPATASLLGP